MVLNSEALQLVEKVRSGGGRFTVDGDRLGVSPRTAAEPFAEQIRQHKAAIISLLRTSTDPAQQPTARSASVSDANTSASMLSLPAGVRLIRYEPKAPPVQLSQCSTVMDTEKFIGTTLAQLDAKLNGKSWQAGNWPLSTLIERLAAVGVEIALDDPKQAWQ